MITTPKKDDNQLVFKLGLTVALWFAAFLSTRLGNKSTRPSLPPSDVNEEVESGDVEIHDDADVDPGDSNSDAHSREERDNYEEEIQMLRSTVTYLRERETSVETQLLEYYGLKEQEMLLTDLQNQLEMSKAEARVHSLKIESLQSENKRLVDELEAARAKIKVLKSKLRSDAEQNKEQILRLKQRVVMLGKQEKDSKSNSERIWRSEAVRLQEENENMRNERYGEVEELVYLRWINACLRYELRNYNPPNGKTVARELSKSLSPRSESKAKQLILEYAEETAADYDQWSPSQSFRSDSGELANKLPKRLKFLGKLRSLIMGKDIDNHSHSKTHHKSGSMVRSRSFEDLGKAYSSIVQRRNSISTPTQNSTSSESMKPNLNPTGCFVSSSLSI